MFNKYASAVHAVTSRVSPVSLNNLYFPWTSQISLCSYSSISWGCSIHFCR